MTNYDVVMLSRAGVAKHYIDPVSPVGQFKKNARLVGRIGSGSRLVGGIGSGVRVSGSFQIVALRTLRAGSPPGGFSEGGISGEYLPDPEIPFVTHLRASSTR